MSDTTTPNSGAADLPEALRRSTAADGKTELFNLPGYPLMVRAVDFNRIHAESEMRRAALLDEMQKAAPAAGQATAAPAQPAPSGATEEVENLRKALVYAAFALHDTPQYMLAQGMTLIDGDTVRVSRDGWTVEASGNPYRQPAPATQPAPVLWVSPEQFANFMDSDEAPFGKYVPARKTSAGNFTMPLFASHGQAPAKTGNSVSAQAESVWRDADRIEKWSDRVQRAHPKSEPEFWPDALRVKYMADEISDLRAAIDAARKQGATQ